MPPHTALSRRLLPPNLPVDTVERSRLADLCQDLLRFRLALLHAPAGTGKTTLISQWHDSLGRDERCDVLWYSVFADEGDPRGLADYLLLALRFGSGQNQPPDVDRIEALDRLRSILEERCRLRPLVLFIDDFHLCEGEDGNHVIESLLSARILGLTLVISSRTRLGFPISRRRASGEILEISPVDLQFEITETVEFFRKVGIDHLSDDISSKLFEQSEGLAVALRLMALILRQEGDAGAALRGGSLQIGNGAFADYFMEEVIAGLAPEIAEFLENTSILESLSPDLCNAITGRQDAGKILEGLAQARLFVVALPGAQRWYRYHHLFQEFLRNRLFLSGEHQRFELHRKAAEWYLLSGTPFEAVAHAFWAQNLTWAAELIEQYCLYDYLSYGHFNTYARWMQQLPQDARAGRPLLGLLMVWRQINQRRFHQARQSLTEIESWYHSGLATKDAIADQINIPGRLKLMRALVGAYSGDFRVAQHHLCDLGDTQLDDQAFGQVDLESIGSYLAFHEGKFAQARDLTRSAFAHYDQIACHWGAIHSLCIDAMVLKGQARIGEALIRLKQAQQRGQEHFSTRSYMVALPSALIGELYFLQGDFEKAEAVWNDALDADRPLESSGLNERTTVPLVGLARLYDLTGRRDVATKLLANGSRRAFELDDFLTEFVLALERADRSFRWGDVAVGQRELDRAELQLAEARRRFPDEFHGIWDRYKVTKARAFMAIGQRIDALALLEGISKDARVRGARLTDLEAQVLRAELTGEALLLSVREQAKEVGISIVVLQLRPETQKFGTSIDRDFHPPELDFDTALCRLKNTYGLTSREIDVLPLIANGMKNAEIAEVLSVNINTVKTHLKSIFSKLGVQNRTQASILFSGLLPS